MKKTPPLFLACAILFWGWRAELLWWAAPMAALLELSNVIAARWEFTEKELRRVWDLCMLLWVGELVLLVADRDLLWGQKSFKFFQWLPIPLYPMMLAQVFGNMTTVPLSVFSALLRRTPKAALARKAVNITWFYYAICLVGGCATAKQDLWFYPAAVALMAAALLVFRPRRTLPAVWILLVALSAASGLGAARGLFVVQNALEGSFMSWVAKYFTRSPSYRESMTALGQLGRIRLSGRILWRVEPEESSPPPSLLREASFNRYSNEVWRAEGRPMAAANVDPDDTALLMPGRSNLFAARISGDLDRGRGLLPLPHGTARIEDIPASMSTNGLGAARVEDAPGFVDFRALFGRERSIDGAPDALDIDVPSNEKAVLDGVIAGLNLEGKTDGQKIRAISQFFQANFSYTMNITKEHLDPTGAKTPLGQFLTANRKGHCEYFATATVLLLRAAGIPARYAIGFGVQEKSGKTYLVRERHGHAWTLVYRKESQRWEELDTTPASWSAEEAARANLWEKIADVFSSLRHGFNEWRYGKTSYVAYLKWLLVPLIGILAWRVFARRRRHLSPKAASASHVFESPGLDSEFYAVERALDGAGMGRFPEEPPRRWLRRARPPAADRIETMFRLHQRLRFDPNGLPAAEREALRSEAAQWLADFAAQKPRAGAP